MDSGNQIDPAGNPPMMQGMMPMEPSEPAWPKVIGILSIIYAVAGMLCLSLMGTWFVVGNQLPEMMRGGVTLPPVMRVVGGVQIVLTFVIGVIMLTGAIHLLRRRRSGVARLKLWALLRMVMIVIQVVASVLMGRAQIEMGHQQTEYMRRMYAERNINKPVPEPSDQEIWQRSMIMLGVTVGLMSVYPVFLGLYLSRRKITDQVEKWR